MVTNGRIDRYKHVSYLCSLCNMKRGIMINQFTHLNRKDLLSTGLALYIDVHKNEDEEHGVKLQIDEHYLVRSNNPMKLQNVESVKTKSKNIPGIPSPSFETNEIVIDHQSISWNSFHLQCDAHNISLKLVNQNMKPINEQELIILSPLASVLIKIAYNSELLTDEYISRTNNWIKIISTWIELTSEFNTNLIIPILRFIDKNHYLNPLDEDEIAVAILTDTFAMIKLKDEKLNYYTYLDYLNQNNSIDDTNFNPSGLNYILEILNSLKFVNIHEFTQNLDIVGGSFADAYVDTLLLVVFDLLHQNLLEYRVTYLT